MNSTCAANWNRLTGQSGQAFEKQMLRGLPGGTTLTLGYDGAGSFNLLFERTNTTNPLLTDLRFSYNGRFGSSMTLNSANSKLRGHNVSGRIHRNLWPFIKRMGIKDMWADTGTVGSYLWAVAGFQRDTPLSRLAQHRFNALANLVTPETRRTITQAFASPSPKAIWAIADCPDLIDGKPVGYLVLQGTGWVGFCNFEDPESRQRFKAHMNGKRLPPYRL